MKQVKTRTSTLFTPKKNQEVLCLHFWGSEMLMLWGLKTSHPKNFELWALLSLTAVFI